MLFSYIDSINTKKHLMLVYDDIKKGRETKYYFLRRGLEKGERCIYLTHGDPKFIEHDMARHGIDVRHHQKNGMLHVCQIQNPVGHSESILNSMQNIMKCLPIDPKIPFRIVGRLIPDVEFEEGMSVELYLEKTFHALFGDLNGSVMCTYDLSQIQSNNNWREWLAKLEMCHDASLLNICDKTQVKICA
jgi:MEDS: MEthanogen/methylotroph, DcmR Sensory domain